MSKHLSDRETIYMESRAEWRKWLLENHTRTQGIWLITNKKAVGIAYVSYDDIVEEALCFGWIDSLPRKLDEQRKMLYLSPRKKGSNWSALNKMRVEKLMEAGLMTAVGLAKIEQAKGDGSWSFLDEVDARIIPPDLKLAFEAKSTLESSFRQLPEWYQRGLLETLKNAKRPETRAKQIERIVSICETGQVKKWIKNDSLE